MSDIENVTLLHKFFLCSHLLQPGGKYRGQGRILGLLLDNGTLTQKELIEITGRTSATLSEQLDSMEQNGLIVRTRNEQDKRNVDVTLTTFGQSAAKEARAYRLSKAETRFGFLTDEEKEQLLALLSKLHDAWKSLPQE